MAEAKRAADRRQSLETGASDWLGQEIPTAPQIALCRCGESTLKPICDGACATSGFSDNKDPKDEIIRAVRDCASGALSYAVDGIEARDQVDWERGREPSIEITKDGPYRITGGIPLTDPDGQPVKRAQGSSVEHYALCRCGHSQNKPFCSGMHLVHRLQGPRCRSRHAV